MPFDLMKSLREIAEKKLPPKLIGAMSFGILVWYFALGIETQFRFPYVISPMFDLNTYIGAFTQALQGKDPYAYSDVWTAYLYPLPGLLIAGVVSLVQESIPRASAYIAVNLALLALMLKGIAARYGYGIERVWWWFPLAFGFAPLLELLYVGQINLISSFGVYLMFAYYSVLPALAGLGLTLAAVTKLTPLVFLAYLVIVRRYRVVFWVLVFVAAAYGISYLLFGWQPPETYLGVISFLSQRFSDDSNAMSLVSSLYKLGWIEQGAWSAVQRVLLMWTALVFAASAISALLANEFDPLFIVMNLGIVVASNVLWYHHYVFLLLPIFVWIAWSRFHPAVIGWCFLGLVLIQVDRGYFTQGLLPHLFVHLSMLGIMGWQLARIIQAKKYAWVFVGAGSVLSLLTLGWLVSMAINANTNLVKAREWIDQNLPAGAHVAVESNGPFIDSQNRVVESFGDLFAQRPDWYEKNGWEYLVTGYRNTNLLAEIPVVSSAPPRDYRDFFSGFPPVAHVAENGNAIWIFKTGAILPERRAYARWGINNAEWLELVGYDKSKSASLPGEPANLTLYWRSILPRRDRLELTIHWLDSSDQDVAISHQLVFPSVDATGRWPDGITRVPVQIALPATTPPGLYRVELELAAPDTLGKGNIPVLSREQKPISDKFYIGPFKVAPPAPSPDSVGMRVLKARFGDTLDLRSYSLKNDAVRPGETVTIKLLWQSIAKTGKDYTVFVHLLDASGNVRAQVDTPPLKGTYPTSIWDSGELVEDEYDLMLPDNLPLGDYKIEVGLYEYPSLARLPVIDSEGKGSADHLLLPDTIKLIAP